MGCKRGRIAFRGRRVGFAKSHHRQRRLDPDASTAKDDSFKHEDTHGSLWSRGKGLAIQHRNADPRPKNILPVCCLLMMPRLFLARRQASRSRFEPHLSLPMELFRVREHGGLSNSAAGTFKQSLEKIECQKLTMYVQRGRCDHEILGCPRHQLCRESDNFVAHVHTDTT